MGVAGVGGGVRTREEEWYSLKQGGGNTPTMKAAFLQDLCWGRGFWCPLVPPGHRNLLLTWFDNLSSWSVNMFTCDHVIMCPSADSLSKVNSGDQKKPESKRTGSRLRTHELHCHVGLPLVANVLDANDYY